MNLLRAGVSQLLNEVQTISESYERVAEATGENFNIFSIMLMETDEVRTHSRFISALLNPKGSHGQKDIFLKRFIEQMDISNFATEKSEVIVEHYIGKVTEEEGGRLDILIKDTQGNTIMIENKIYAGEQMNQLVRYKNHHRNGTLFYLTLFGDESENKTLTSGVDYTPISYETDIINWLEKCKRDSVNIPILRESISQYINLLKKLTHQNLNRKMSIDIVNRIIKDEESLNAYEVLINAKRELFIRIMEDVFIPFVNELAKEGGLELHINEDEFLNSDKPYVTFHFESDLLKKYNTVISFQFQRANHSGLIFGFPNDKNKHNRHPKLESKFKSQFLKCRTSPSWACYTEYKEFYDWEDVETLKRMKFKFGDFQQGFKNRIESLLNVVNEIENEAFN